MAARSRAVSLAIAARLTGQHAGHSCRLDSARGLPQFRHVGDTFGGDSSRFDGAAGAGLLGARGVAACQRCAELDLSGARAGQGVCHVLGDRRDGSGVGRHVLGQFVGERRKQPAGALGGLVKVAGPEEPAVKQPQDHRFHDGPDGLEQVQHEAVARLLVGVADAQSRVESDRDCREAAFGFGQRVAVVEQGVDRVGGVAADRRERENGLAAGRKSRGRSY